MVILLGSDCVINGGLTAKAGFRGVVDCANFSCSTITTKEVSGNNGKATFLNCPSFTGSKVINITHDYFNCDRVTLSSFNAGNTATLNFYDCGTAATPATFSVGSYSSGPSATTTHNFYSGYYNSLSYKTCYKVYGGSYKTDPSNYNADVDNLEVVYDSVGKWYNVLPAVPAEKVCAIGGMEYTSLSAAIDAAANGDTITLIAAVDMAQGTAIVPSGKNITISLEKHSISNGKIVNNGTLTIVDSTIDNDGDVASDIENNGTLDFVFGTYSGAVVNKTGTLTVHNGAFTGSFTKTGGTVNLKGGHFKTDVSSLVTSDDYLAYSSGGFYYVCEVPNGTMSETTVSGKSGYSATPYNDADYNLLKDRVSNNKTTKSDYTATNWIRLAELLTFYEVFYNASLDATLQFDRVVPANSLSAYASTGTFPQSLQIKHDLDAGELYRGLSAVLVGNGYYGKQYKALWEDSIKSVSLAVSDGSSGSNAGTLCRTMIELWTSVRAPDYHDPDNKHMLTNTLYVAGQKLFTLSAGSNKAMIRPARGAATFYATLGAAMNAATDGGRVMLANDCDTALPLNKAGTYTFDTMGFAASDAVSVSDGLFVKSETAVDSSAKGLVPDAKATTYVVAQKVALVGETFYDNLTEAVGAANGTTVTLLAATDETITLGEGQTLSLNKNGIAFDDAKVVTSVEGSSVKATTAEGVTVYSLVKDVVTSGEAHYPSIEAAVAATEGGTVAVTVIAADTETIALVAGKTLSVTVADGVTADVTVNPAEGTFIETSTDGATTTYVSKKITVEMKEPTATVAVTKIDNGTESEVTDAAEIAAVVAKMTGNNDVPRTDNTDKLDVLDKITVTPTKIVEEVKGGKTVIRSATFDVTPNLNAGQSLGEGQKLKFRLPVDAAATQLAAIVYHSGAQFGIYPVQTYNNEEKFVEVESDTFSPYGYELLDGETANPVAAIGTTGYSTLAAALAAALDGETVTLISGPDTAISAKGEVTGGKTVTVTGTAKFNWGDGWLMVGRGSNAGDGTLIFKDATITRSSDQSSYGFNISCKKKNSATTCNGTVIITNSTIDCDYMINKGTLAVYGKGTVGETPDLTVHNGWGVGGRPAGETESGEHATATVTLSESAYVKVVYHNGMGNGYEGNAVMTLTDGSVFEYTGGSFANGDNCSAGATGKIVIDATSLFKATKFQNTANGNSSIAIDATGITDPVKVIDCTNSGATDLAGYGTVTVTGGEAYVEDGDLWVKKPAVAQIGETKYETLEAAIAAANADDTVQLLTDVELDEAVDIAKSITLDLNGKTVSISEANEDGYAISVSSGTVTVTGNGTIDAGEDIALDVAGGSVTIANGTFSVIGVDDGSLTITDGTFNGGLLTVDGTTIINGGTFNDVVDVGGGAVIINNGAFTAADNVLMVTDAEGTLTVNGGTFAATPSGEGDPIVVYVEGGEANLTGGTFTGGTIATDEAETGTLTVSGGFFSALVPEEYCANGYIPTAQNSETGLYSVTQGSYYDVWVGGTQLSSINAADVFGDGKVSYDAATKTLTLNGYTYSGAGYGDSAVYIGDVGGATFNIVVAGENSLTSTAAYGYAIRSVGTGAVTVTGSGSDPSLALTVPSAYDTGYAVSVKGTSATFKDLSMAVTGYLGIVVNGNNAAGDALTIDNCDVVFDGTAIDQAIWVYNPMGDGTVSIENGSSLTGKGAILVYGYGTSAGDANLSITDSTVNLTGATTASASGSSRHAIEVLSNVGDSVLTIDNSTVTVTASNGLNPNGNGPDGINVGSQMSANGKGLAKIDIKNGSVVTATGNANGVNLFTWGDSSNVNPCGAELSVVDSTLNASATHATGGHYGIVAYAYQKGDTSVVFENSAVNASAPASAGIYIGAGEDFNADVGNLSYEAIDSDVTTSGPYGLVVSTVSADGNNTSAMQTVDISGGSFTCNGLLFVYGDDGENTASVSMSDVTAQIGTTTATEEPVLGTVTTGELSIDSGDYTILHAADLDAFDVADGNISGGNFNEPVPEELCADTYIPTPQDPVTGKYTVKVGSYVAQIGDVKYETFAEAIVAAEAYKTANGDYPVITVLDATAEQTNPDWKIADGKLVHKVYVAQIGTTKYETVEDALTVAQTAGATIEILANSTETPNHALEVLMGGDITLTSSVPVRVEIAPTAKTSSVDNDGMAYIRSVSADARCTFTVGANVTLAFPATAAGAGAMYVGYSSANAADMVINGRLELYEPYVGSLSTLTVNPSGSIKSISECLIVRWGATVDVIGTGSSWSDANPQAEFAYVELQGGVTTLKDTYAKGGAWVHIFDRNNKAPDYATKLVLTNAVLATSKINNAMEIDLDINSQIVTPEVVNTGSINIDATGITQAAKVIDYTGSGTLALADYGTVNVTGGTAYVDGNDLWITMPPVAEAYDAEGGTLIGQFSTVNEAIAAAGATYVKLLDNVTLTAPLTMTKSYTLDFNGKTIYYNTTATTVINGSSNIIFKNGKLDISSCAISSSTDQGLLIFKFNPDGNILTFDKVELYGKNCRTYGIFSFANSTNGSTVNFINGSRIAIENESNLDYSDIFKGLGSTYPYVVNITDSTVSCTNVTRFSLYGTVNVKDSTVTFTGGENAFRQGAFTFDNSTVTVSGAKAGEGKGLVPRFSDTIVTNGSALTFIGSNIGKDVLFEYANNIVIYDTSTVTAASVSGAAADRAIIAPANYVLVTTDNGGASVTYSVTPAVARIGDTYYATFAEAIAAADAAVAGGGADPVIIVLDQTAAQDNADWIFATDSSVEPPVTTLVRRTYYNVWVGGTRIAADNAADVFGDGKVSYDDVTKTLTLNGYTYSGAGYENSAIYATEDIAIVVQGENSLTSTAGNCIYAGGTISVTGTGTTPTLNIAAKSNSYALQVAGVSAAFTNVTMAVSGNRGFVVNENNAPADSIDIKGCNITFANGTDRALQVWNGEGDSLLTIADSTVTGVGRIVMFAEGDTGDTTCFITNSTVALTDSQIESYNGDATVEISESAVSMTGGANNKNGAFNVGARYGANTTASVKILNNSDVTCSGQYSGINVWTWGENGPQASEIIVEDSTLTSSGSYYGLSAYSIYEGDTSVYFKDSTVNATGAISAIEMCSDASYNAVGDKTYTQIDSDVTLTTTQYAYGLDLDNSTSGGVNGDAYNTATITGGSLTCNGCGLYVVGDDNDNSSVTMHDANVTIDVTGRDWYPIVTGELSIDSGSYTVIDPDENGLAADVGNITGGIFSEDVSDSCAAGYAATANTDAATKDDYPYVVLPAVASITVDDETTYYATFADAIAAADDAVAAGEDDPVIVVIDPTAPQPNDAWKFADNNTKLVRKAYVAQIVRGGEVIAKYESFDEALDAAESGDTVQLLADVTGVTTTYNIDKTLTIDGQGQYAIVAGENTDPRSVVDAWGGSRVMFDMTRSTANVTFKDITIDNGEGHYYSFLARVKSGTTTFEDATILHGAEADASGADGVGYGAAVQVDGGNVLVTGDFYADTHGAPLEAGETGDRAAGIFPFTAFLYQDGGIRFDDGVNVSIGQDLLLVGMVGAMDVANDEDRQMVQEMLDQMNVPAGYYPYTLKLGDNSLTSFTGASPLGWNDIIDYGKEIMTATSALGMDMDPTTTPVEVGLLSDTVLPDTFTFEDSNFTVDGNGYALSGTIEYTDTAGLIHDIVMGTDDNALVLDMTGVTQPIEIGSGIVVDNVTIKMTEDQATAGTPVIIWDVDGGVVAPENEAGVTVALVDGQGEPTGDTANLIWDDEMGMAYIGPCEARLTGPTHEQPIYTSLANAIAQAAQSGDTVTLLMDIENFSGTQFVSKQDLVIDGAGYKIAAAPVTTHRDIVNAWAGSTAMFKLETGDITFRDITLDGDATHAYTFLISADNSSVSLTTEDITLLNGGELCGDASGQVLEAGAGYGAAIHLNNGAALTVKDGFYADTHGAPSEAGQADGCFPFTGILPEGGSSVLFDLVDDSDENPTVEIGKDLLLVGMVGVIPLGEVQGILDYMKVPSRFIPYTLTLGDGSAYAFTGASPLGWNDIIDYGKDIMDASTAIGYEGLDKDSTPVEVGLLTDTVLPDTFTFEDSNFTVNGNGNALSGTIKYTDDAGVIKNIVLGTENAALVLDMTEVMRPVELGSGVDVENVQIKMTEEQAVLGHPVFFWDVSGEDPVHDGTLTVQVVDAQGDSTGVTKGLVWDNEMGVAYIGPCEARLTGPERDPAYMDLMNAFATAVGGETVTLFMPGVTLDDSVALPAGELLFTTNVYELTLGENAAFTFTNATTVFRTELDAVDFIALAGDCATGYWLRHEADGITNVYSVVERGEYTVVGDLADGTAGTATIKASDEWVAANVGANVKTINEIEKFLNSTNSTVSMREWEKYVLNQTAQFKVTAVSAANDAVTSTLVEPASAETTGFAVAYSFDRIAPDFSLVEAGTPAVSHSFTVPIASVSSNAIYRIRVHLTSGGTTLVVDSLNAVGVMKVVPTALRSIVAVPWRAFGGGDISVADFIRESGLGEGDALHAYNGSSYDTWTFENGGWTASRTFLANESGTSESTVEGTAAEYGLASGTGVWLERAGDEVGTVCMVGEYSRAAVTTALTAGESAKSPSWNLVAPPSVFDSDLNELFPDASAADRIVVPTASLQRSYTFKNGKWGFSDSRKLANGRVQTFHNTDYSTIPAGTGFWYLNGGAAKTIEW